MGSRRIAVIDLGTNSTRLLVGEVADGSVAELERRTNVTRLGEGVDEKGRLSEGGMGRVYETVAGYRDAIDLHRADEVVGVATSAVRDADNRDEFVKALESRFGVEVRTIPGEEEATLTFLGATGGRRTGSASVLVLDIGGGSTEFVVGRPGGDPDLHASTRIGSVRHTERHLLDDPPTPAQVAALSEAVRQEIDKELPAPVREGVAEGIAVAGTATSLAAIDQALEPYDPARVHGYPLRLAACGRMLEMLAALPLEERRQVTGLHPDRAPTIVAGAAILIEAMRAFGLDQMETSEADLLHGAALTAAREGAG